MPRDLDNFSSLDDFARARKSGTSIRQQSSIEIEPESVSSQPFTLSTLLSGDTYTATTETVESTSGSTPLDLNYSDLHNLALFGSVYLRVQIAVQRVQEEYPNGFLISTITSGSSI